LSVRGRAWIGCVALTLACGLFFGVLLLMRSASDAALSALVGDAARTAATAIVETALAVSTLVYFLFFFRAVFSLIRQLTKPEDK